jgi:FAD/FMN-containing dehydrogenase/ferredoxin
MIIETPLEAKLYTQESVELPDIIKERFPKIQFVFQPENPEGLQWLFSYSKKNRLSLIPRGAATSGIGALAPLRRSVMADLTRLNRILDFDQKNKTISIEAGMRWRDLRLFLKRYSLDLFTYPTSLFSTVGGWLSTGGFGINSFRYGHISSAVDSIEVLTPQSKVCLDSNDRDFKYFLGTEGQMGIITKVKLKVREAAASKPYLILFKTKAEAIGFLSELVKSSAVCPSHISYFDHNRLEHKNLLLRGKASFPESEAVLVAFEGLFSEQAFLNLAAKNKGEPAEDYLTSFLWNERFFPFSIRCFYPSLLGSEVILPIDRLENFLERARSFGDNCHLRLSTEASFINRNEAVVFTLFPSDPKKFPHFFHLLLTYSLAHTALSCGGKPYGIGLWNLPQLEKKFSAEAIKDFRLFKKEIDSANLLNPSKSFSPDLKVAYLLKIAFSISSFFSKNNHLLSPLSKILALNHKKQRRLFPETEACSNCGACTAVCPSYLMNGSEIVTAKGKLFLLKELLRGTALPQACAEKVFLCLHCHLCEYVCQSKLTLVPVWEKFESIVEKNFGRPAEKIDEFIKRVDSDPTCAELLDSLSLSSSHLKGVSNV